MRFDDTIAAFATPSGCSALAVIRMSGPDAHAIFQALVTRPRIFERQNPHTIALFTLKDTISGNTVDEVTVVKYVEPRSFTGEQMVEIICHGGEYVSSQVIKLLVSSGARPAQKGEFSRRAFLNGKMGILKTEAIASLVESRTREEYENALSSYQGEYREKFEVWQAELKRILISCESLIEFGEEDSVREEINTVGIITAIAGIAEEISREVRVFRRIRQRATGMVIPLIGPPNAGKSTVFNMLVRAERSIVHTREGTTRDSVSEYIRLDDTPVTLVDTAGIGPGREEIEMIGIRKSWEYASSSSIIIWITEACRGLTEAENDLLEKYGERCVAVINKIDLNGTREKADICRSRKIPYRSISMVRNQHPLEEVCGLVRNKIDTLPSAGTGRGVVANARQERILLETAKILKGIREQSGEEIIAQQLREASEKLQEYAGKITSDEILNAIFDSMCIGK